MYPNQGVGPGNVSKSKSWDLGMYPNQGVGPWECIPMSWALRMYPNQKVGFWERIEIKELATGNVSKLMNWAGLAPKSMH